MILLAQGQKPQDSALGPLLFNIYFNDLFMFLKETKICNYVDDTTIYVCGPGFHTVHNHLERDALRKQNGFFTIS